MEMNKNILPFEIINKILMYKSDLDNDIIIIQYNPINKKELYIINKKSILLYNIHANLMMKRLYPLYDNTIILQKNIDLYYHGMNHYKNIFNLVK